jgi:polar amino acid transport system substrate-binding protein
MKNLSASILLLFCLASNASELTLLTENFPPYNFGSRDNVVGINAELLSRACYIANVSCTFDLLPWKRAFKIASTEQNRGVFSTARTPNREDGFIWIGPIVSGNGCFYRLKSRKDIVVTNAESLKNYTVGITRGDTYETVLKRMGFQEGENFLTFANKHDDSKMFRLGRMDLLIGSSLTLASQLHKVGLNVEDVVPVLALNDASLGGNFLALNKESNSVTAQSLQQALDFLKQNGEIDPIVSRYAGEQSRPDASLPVHLTQCLSGRANY